MGKKSDLALAAGKDAEPYQPRPDELLALQATKARSERKRTPRLKVAMLEGNTSRMELTHPDLATSMAMLLDAFASGDFDFGEGVLGDLTQLSSAQGIPMSDARLNYALSIVKGIQPRDEVETLLGVQMAAIHMATILQARRFAHCETIQQQDSLERALNKLARTFTTQVETLKRYRSKGEQRVYVERVTVNEGGQAIVGNVSKGEG